MRSGDAPSTRVAEERARPDHRAGNLMTSVSFSNLHTASERRPDLRRNSRISGFGTRDRSRTRRSRRRLHPRRIPFARAHATAVEFAMGDLVSGDGLVQFGRVHLRVVRAAGLPHRQQARPGDEPQALVRLDAQRNRLSGRPGPPSGQVALVTPRSPCSAELAEKKKARQGRWR